MFYMSTRFLKYDIYAVRVPQFQLAYIHDTTNNLHSNLANLCCDVYYMRW